MGRLLKGLLKRLKKNMEFIQTQKYVIMSPRKLRLVANLVKDLSPQRAVETLPHFGKRAAEPIKKVILAAIANAVVGGISPEKLEIKEIQIGEGPRLKRGRPVAKGAWHPYQKKMSHIRVVLIAKEELGTKTEKSQKNKLETKRSVKKTEKKLDKKNVKTTSFKKKTKKGEGK